MWFRCRIQPVFRAFFFIIQFLGFSLLFYLLGLSSIQGVIFPFGYGLLFALAWANQKIWIVCPAFMIGSVLADLTFQSAISSLVCIFVLCAVYLIFAYKKKVLPKWALFVVALFSQTGKVAFSLCGGESIVFSICHLFVGLGFMFMLITLFEALGRQQT